MDMHLRLEGRSGLADQVYQQLRTAILDGRLRAGERLPTTRDLVRQLSISRGTVAVAYDRLAGEGLIIGHVGSGTFVSQSVRPTMAGPVRSSLRPVATWDEVPDQPDLTAERPAFDIRAGLPDAGLFPYDAWRRVIGQQLRGPGSGMASYTNAAGEHRLRSAGAAHLARARALRADPADMLITTGTQQSVNLAARVLLTPGDRVAVEDPGYPPVRRLLASVGARVECVRVDGEGLVVDDLHPVTRMVVVTPSHQFPLGVTMPLRRRMALLNWADRYGAAVVEDDYDSEFRYDYRPHEPLHTLDGAGRVLFASSFSKTMLPALRIGLLVAPPSLRSALHKAKHTLDWHNAPTPQLALAQFIEDGHFARHIRRMRRVYSARRSRLLEYLARNWADIAQVVPSTAGLHICVLLPGHSVEQVRAGLQRAGAAGIALAPLSQFCVVEQRAGLVIGYGSIDLDRIPEALDRLRGFLS